MSDTPCLIPTGYAWIDRHHHRPALASLETVRADPDAHTVLTPGTALHRRESCPRTMIECAPHSPRSLTPTNQGEAFPDQHGHRSASVPDWYRKKPVTVRAVRWTGDNAERITQWIGSWFRIADDHGTAAVWVDANGQWLDIEIGEWIIRDSQGCYPCKPDIFAATYEHHDGRP